MCIEIGQFKPCTESIRGLNFAVVKRTAVQVTHCRFGVVK
jgi:hypothetical protein